MSAYDELLQFIEESRRRISDVQVNNRFGSFASALAEDRATLDIVVSRYREVSEQFFRNQQQMEALIKPGTHRVTDELFALQMEAVRIQRLFRLEVRSF